MTLSKIAKTASLSVLLAYLILTFSADAAVQAFRNVAEGQPVPAFTLKDTAGSDVTLAPGKVTVVLFMKPDQDKSREALADLQKVYAEYGAKGVTVVGVMSESGEENALGQIISQDKITYPVALDPGRKVYGEWGAFLYPTTAIVGKDGKLFLHVSSHNRKYLETVEGNVRLALGEITKEQLDEALNPKEKEKLTAGQKESERRMMLARKLVERKLYDKAMAELEQAVTADPNNAEARVDYGFLLLKTGDAAKAAENFAKAAELNPKAEDAKAGLGGAMAAQGEVDKGIEVLTGALKSNPKPARAHFELGKAYEKKGAFDKAAENYRKAIEYINNGW